MPSRSARHASPADLVALAMRVQSDERATRGDQLAHAARWRDALENQANPPASDTDRLLWLIDQPGDPAIDERSGQARSGLTMAGLILVVIGLLSGVALASGVFYYDGNAPVNVVAVLGVFVGLQGILLMLAVLAALPRGCFRWLPGMAGVQEALRLASPGRLALLSSRLLPQDMREALSASIGRSGAHQRVYASVQFWVVLRWSQLYALAVNLAAVLVFLYLVFFTDLAFGWSTTLKVQPAQFHDAMHALALPWSWQPSLTPSMELVERSRYYRGTHFDPQMRGGWWPFLLSAMLVYGLLPRLIAFTVASIRLRRSTRVALLATPGALELLSRLSRPATSRGGIDDDDAASDVPGNSAQAIVLGGRPVVIDWSRAAGSPARAVALLGLEPAGFEPAGGSRTVEDDRQTLAAVGKAVTADGVLLLVKLWEPPVIETTCFLSDLRKAIGDRLPVRVVPVASDLSGRVIGEDPVLVEQWRRRVHALGDPWTAVAEPVGLADRSTEARDA